MRDLYRILGIPDNATMADIKSAYRRLAKQYHPDLNPGSRQSEEKFKEILDAYTILSDEELRAQYDRKRRFGNAGPFTPYNSAAGTNGSDKKKGPPRKEYPPEYIEMLRQRNRTRIVKQIQRRKKLLRGMIITFVLYLLGTAYFEHWIHERNQDANKAFDQQFVSDKQNKTQGKQHGIGDMASPFDKVFGEGIFAEFSPNQIVVINPFSDAVICLQRLDSSNATIRNEFITAQKIFFMKQIPNGNYAIKVYSGRNWDEKKTIPGIETPGGFSTNEKFFVINRKPITLTKPTYNNPNTIISDTVRIDTSGAQIREITREEFFSPGSRTAGQ